VRFVGLEVSPDEAVEIGGGEPRRLAVEIADAGLFGDRVTVDERRAEDDRL
jgi:hypothetical protein